jgi:phosphoribosylanthranilate isomerase
MQIKVCGMKNPQNIEAVLQLKPNYLGFIFYDQSPRFVANLPETLLQNIPNTVEKVAVFVNETLANIFPITQKYRLKTIQLHGQESPLFCKNLQAEGFKVWKAFNIAEIKDIEHIANYAEVIDLAVLDAKGKSLGGNGTVFDWNLLENYTYKVPFLLSGGISMDNIAKVLQLKHEQLVGIDVNSKFELEAGIKDVFALQSLFAILSQSLQKKEENITKLL